MAELNGGRALDALLHFKSYTRRATAKPENIEVVKRDLIPQAWSRTAHIEIAAPPGTEITVDGKLLPDRAPLSEPVDVMPGKHLLEFRRGRAEGRVEQSAEIGKVTPVAFAFPEAPREPSPSPTTTMRTETHDAASPGPPRRSFWTTRNVVAVGLGVGALAAGGIGVGYALGSSSASDTADGLRPTLGGASCLGSTSAVCQQLGDLRKTFDSDRTLETGFFIGGAVLAAAAIGTIVFWPSAKTEGATRVSVVPVWRAGGGGASVVGRF